MMYCTCCGRLLSEEFFFCQQCGTKRWSTYIGKPPHNVDEKELITHYFNLHYSYSSIIHFLELYHNIIISLRTLKRRLKSYGLKRNSSNIDQNALTIIIEKEIQGPASLKGYRGMWTHLRCKYGITVKRDTVMELLRHIDPEGTEIRRSRRLNRRVYRSRGPNHCWHVDGYDKLKPYGLPIHGCVDGFSRKILWLKVTRSNNNPVIPAYFFLNTVRGLGYCSQLLRSDCGTENGIMADCQCFLRDCQEAHAYGTSVANQRIENWWSHCKRGYTAWVIDFFKQLVVENIFVPGNYIHTECIWFVFSRLLQNELDEVSYEWNTHYIRRSRHDTVPGIPDELFHLPTLSNHENCKILISDEEVQNLLNERDIISEGERAINEQDDDLVEFFNYTIETENILYPPRNWREGRIMFETIIQRCI